MRLICDCGQEIANTDITIINAKSDDGSGYMVDVSTFECICSVCKLDYDAGVWYHTDNIEEAKQVLAGECEELTIKE